jgi:APA family basic amino acid/polyamine antiporter
MCVVLLLSLMATPTTRNFFLIYLALGIVIYFLYGIRKSELGRGIVARGSGAKPMELPHIGDP